MFKLVIIDTPGTDSNESDDGKGHNADEISRLTPVFESNGDMVILSINESDVDSKGLSRLVGGISNKFDKDSDVYNDRFLFVVNKCDMRPFTPENTTTDFINRYRKKLKELTKNQSFIPRIFPMCAAVPGALYFKDESCGNGIVSFNKYIYGGDTDMGFMKYHIDPNPNYYFSQYCDVPQYKKDWYEAKFNKIKESDKGGALLIQSGFVCLEDAIKDYVERFAYPIRINRILRTYETIPGSVINCIKAQEQMLKKQRESLETAQDEGKAAEEKEKEEKERADKLAKAKSVLDALKKRVDDCGFDESVVYEIIKKLTDGLNEIRIEYGASKLTLAEAYRDLEIVKNRIKSLLNDYSIDMKKIWKELKQKLSSEFYDAKSDLESEKAQGTFDFGGFDFSQSEAFTGFDSDDFDFGAYEYTEYKKERNPEKDMYYEWWQIFSKVGQLFAPDTITVSQRMVDFGRFIVDKINFISARAFSSGEKIKDEYVASYNKMKENIKNYIDNISKSLESAVKNISENEKTVMNSKKTVQDISSSISSMLSDKEWLERLNKKILVNITIGDKND